MPRLAMERTAHHVVQKAFDFAGVQEQYLIAMALLQAARPISIIDIACSRCGSSMLAELAGNHACAEQIRPRLEPALPRLLQSKFGRRVAAQFSLLPLAAH